MPVRTVVGQSAQIGIEITEGTAVPAIIALKSIDFNLGARGESQTFTPVGGKYATNVVPSKEWTMASLSGKPVYDEIIYLFAGLLGTPVVTTVGTTGKQYVYGVNLSGADTTKTFTLEKGGSVRAHSTTNVHIIDTTFTFNRNEFTISGSAAGRRLADGITMTANPTTLPQVPIIPNGIDVFVDATRGTLGTTKELSAYVATLGFTGHYGQEWTLNSANNSWNQRVEQAPNASASLTVQANASGMAYLDKYRAGQTMYVRYSITGPQIGAGPATYKVWFDFAARINAVNEFADQDGIYAISHPFTLVDDGSGLSPIVVTVVCATASL